MSATAAAPVAYDDLIAAKADTQITLDYLLLNDKDADGNTLSITATTSPAHGTLTALGGNSYRYTPTAGYKGRDTFTYTVSDGTGGTDTALVSISVNAAYDVTAARDTILAGVTQLTGTEYAGVMSAWGPTAASISNFRGKDESCPMIAAATMGAGKVVALPHNQWLNMNSKAGDYTTGTFYKNAIAWIANTTSKTIPILTMSSEVSTWLTAQGYTNVTTTNSSGLAAALPGKTVFIPGSMGGSPSAANITAVKDYIQGGGGFFACEWPQGYAKSTDIPLGKILREAGISFVNEEDYDAAYTINRGSSVVTMDSITAIFQNLAGYTAAEKLRAATVLEQVVHSLPADDIESARCLALTKNLYAGITPTPQSPVTDAFQRKILQVETLVINSLPVTQMTPHRGALSVSATAPRVNGSSFGLVSPPSGHQTKTIYTPYYAAPGELVTIQFPAALTGLNLDVRVSHLRQANGDETSYPVMPKQMFNYDVATAQVQVASPHGGLIQIIVPSGVTWSGTQNITVTGAVQAPYFKLGTTTDAQWVAGIRDRGTPFGVLDSDEATLVIDADKWLRTLADPEAVITEWNYFCGKLRQFYVYNPGRQLPVHHDYYEAGGVSTYPQSYDLTDEITNSLDLKACAYALTLHEYGHICDSGNIIFKEFGETSPNMGGKWLQETERKYSWKQELVVGRINNFLTMANDDLWNTGSSHYSVDRKGTPFDILSAEFGPAMIQQCVAAMTAMSGLSTDQAKVDEWVRQTSNRTGFNMSAFFASWQLNVSASVQSELSSKPNWMPVERVPEALTVAQGTPVIFANPSSNDFSYDGGLTLTNVSQPGSGTISNNGNGTYTYTPAAGFTGSTNFTYTVTNATGNTFTTTVPVKVVATANDPKLTAFDGYAKGGAWTTITLPKSYNSMVVVAQPAVGVGVPPMVARIRNASGSSFEVRLDRLDGSATPVGLTSVRFLAVEEGVYNEATHGIKMEAVKFTSSTTDRAANFAGTKRNFAYTGYDHYFIPAVFGQVMTSNDDRWSAFWYKADANYVQLGKHVGEDTVTTRANETIGYIVMESGSYQFGNDQIQVGRSDFDAYAGFGNLTETGGSHDFVRFPMLHSAQVSASIEVPWGQGDPGMDGFVTLQKLAGGNTLSAYLAEDSIGDAETSTGNKPCSYLLAHRSDGSPVAKADQLVVLSAKDTLIKVLTNDDISGSPTVQVTQQPANGVVTVLTDGTLIYTSNAGFIGSDAFVYTVTNAQGSTSSVVNLQVEAAATSQAGIKADRFNGISGGSVSNLTGSPNFPSNPSASTIWTSVNSGQNVGENLGHRIYGYVVPPTTGDYTFWIASDDNSQLFLSTDFTATNKKQIASVGGWTDYQSWDQSGSQKSAVITLEAGRAYYLEVLHKEGGGGDHVSVAWQGPGFARKVLGNPDTFTLGNTAPTLAAAPSNVSMNEGSPTQVNLAGVFANTDVGDPLTIEVYGNTRPDLVSTSIVGNTLTVSQAGYETGSAVITLRAYDRTNTLVTTSFTVTVNDSVADSDGDGLTDSWEIQHFGNLAAQSGSGDPDGDGLNNAGERTAGTNPNATDSDSDGFADAFEVAQGSNPASAASKPNVAVAALWKFDNNGTPGVTRDEVGVVAGQLLGGATLTADGQGRTGQSGDRALDLGTTNAGQRVEVTSMGFLQQAAQDDKLTISFWQKLEGTGVQRSSFWAVSPTAGDNQRGIQSHAPWSNGTVYFDAGNSSSAYRVSGTPSGVTWTNWNHVALVKDGGTMQVWVNGNLVASETGKAALLTDFTKLYIGCANGATNSLRGKLDDFAVFTTALTQGQIANLAAGGTPQTVAPNTAPAFTTDPIAKSAATEDSAYSASLASDVTDPDAGDTKSFSKVSGPAWLSVASNGALSGTPTNGNVGANSFTVRVTDAAGDSDEAVLNITVNNTNDAPTFGTLANANATEDDVFNGNVASAAADVDTGDTLTFSKVSGPAWLSVASNGDISGTPLNGNVGANNFVLRVTDAAGATADSSLTITVANVNDAPTFGALANANATEDAAFSGNVASAAGDVDTGDTLTFSKVSGPAWLSVASNGAISGTPLNGNVGANNFVLRVTDAAGATADSSLTITVANVNDAPTFGALANANANEDAAFTTSVAGAVNDVDTGDTLTFSKVSGPVWLSVASNGTVSGTPTQNEVGNHSLVIRVTDAASATADSTLTVVVAATNDAPTFTTDPIAGTGATEGSAYSGSIAGTATDVDPSDTLTYSKVSGPSWLSVASNGALTGTPMLGTNGSNSFTVRVTDAAGATDDAVLTIQVTKPAGSGDADGDGFTNALEEALGTDPYNSSSKPDPIYAGLQTWWKLDEASGSAADDTTGRPLDGVLVGSPAWVSGLAGNALTFNGTNQSVQIPTIGLNSNTVTLTAWVKRNGAQVSWAGLVFDRGNSASGLGFGPSNQLRYHWNDASSTYNFSSGLTVPDNTWTFCAVVVEPTKATLYMQPAGGVMQSATNAIAHAAHNFSANMYLGQDSAGGRFYKGDLDDVKIHSRALTATEISQLASQYALPLPWANTTVGTGALAGGSQHANGKYTVSGSGVLGGTADQAHTVYQTLSGDGEIVAKISSLHNTGTSASVGVVVRDSLAVGAPHVFVGSDGAGTYKWSRRTTTAGTATVTNGSVGTPGSQWVKIVRSGNTFTVSTSADGSSWSVLGSASVTMASNCYIGLSNSSGSTTTINTSQFTNVSVTP